MFDGITGVMPLTVMDYYGLVDDCGAYSKTDSLVNDNDTKKLSFTEIANIIESEPKGLFFQ